MNSGFIHALAIGALHIVEIVVYKSFVNSRFARVRNIKV